MNKIKVLHTIRQGKIGGGETYLMNLVTNLNKEAYEPIVLSFTHGAMVNRLKELGIAVHVIETETPFALHVYHKVYKLLKREKIQLVHMHGTRAATNTLIPSKLLGLPAIYTVHGWSFHTGNNPLVTSLRKKAEAFITKNATATICGSEADIASGKKHCGRGKYNLIHNSINTCEYMPENVSSTFREENGFNNDFIIASIARITFQKDPQTFLRAIPKVIQKIPQAKFVMIGNGELKEECVDLANQLGIKNNVSFLPFSQNVKAVLKDIDVFVLPSLWEVIPLGLLEAMAMEKICIGTKIPGTTEALIDGYNGYLFETGKDEQLAEKIIQSYVETDTAENLRKNARETVTEKFDLQKLVTKNEELYKSILEKANV